MCFGRRCVLKTIQYVIVAIILIVATLTIGLCTSLLTRWSSKSNPDSNSNADEATSAAAAATPTSSRTLATCLNVFGTSAPTSPLTYPCDDCVPLLTSTENDFASALEGGNATGVGASLQFCALVDVLKKTNSGGLEGGGWGKDASPCGWSGVDCDDRGRVVEL